MKSLFNAYRLSVIKQSLKTLSEVGLYNRLIFMVLIANASMASNGYIMASIGLSLGKEVATSILGFISIGYQLSKALLPLYRNVSLINLLKIMMSANIISIIIIGLSLVLKNDLLLFFGVTFINIVTISASIAYTSAIQEYMSQEKLRYYIKEFNYTLNTLDIITKVLISGFVGLVSLVYPIIGVIISLLLLAVSIKYQYRFMQEVRGNMV